MLNFLQFLFQYKINILSYIIYIKLTNKKIYIFINSTLISKYLFRRILFIFLEKIVYKLNVFFIFIQNLWKLSSMIKRSYRTRDKYVFRILS